VRPNVGSEPSTQQRFGCWIEFRLAKKFAYCTHRFNESATNSAEVTAFTFDCHHAWHVGEQIGEETHVYSMFGDRESAMLQLVEGEIL